MLIWNRRHLHNVRTQYVQHYNAGRPHRGLISRFPYRHRPDDDALPGADQVERVDVLNGLIHEYDRAA